MSQRRACQVLGQPRSSQRYQAKEESEQEKNLIKRIHELVLKYPRYGYRFMTAKLRQEGWCVNFKRIYRIWRREGLKVPKKTRKKRRLGHSGNSCVRLRAEHRDHVWTWDFIHDRTASGRPLKWLAITDEYTRECLALEVDRIRPMNGGGGFGELRAEMRLRWRAISACAAIEAEPACGGGRGDSCGVLRRGWLRAPGVRAGVWGAWRSSDPAATR